MLANLSEHVIPASELLLFFFTAILNIFLLYFTIIRSTLISDIKVFAKGEFYLPKFNIFQFDLFI